MIMACKWKIEAHAATERGDTMTVYEITNTLIGDRSSKRTVGRLRGIVAKRKHFNNKGWIFRRHIILFKLV